MAKTFSSKYNVAGPADPLRSSSKYYSLLKLSVDDATGKLGLKNWMLPLTPSLHYANADQLFSQNT